MKNKKRLWRQAFSKVMERYAELRMSDGSIGAFNYSEPESFNGGSFNSKIVGTSISDYICDVEIAARRALQGDPLLYSHFKSVYLSGAYLEIGNRLKAVEALQMIDERVQLRVGKMFVRRRLHRVGAYFTPKDVR
jgi:hypothetical protein